MNINIYRAFSQILNAPAIIGYLITIPAALITLTLHEYFHGFAAYKLGDRTAMYEGRLTLNPLKHIDPVGAVCMILFKIGWAKPVPIDARYFKKPKRDMAITALAGPLSNLLLSFVSLFIYLLIGKITENTTFGGFPAMLVALLMYFFFVLHSVNLGIGIFNLIPIPPLDGSRILLAFLPTKYYFKVMYYEKYIAILLFALLYLGSFSGILSMAMNAVSNIMLKALSFMN